MDLLHFKFAAGRATPPSAAARPDGNVLADAGKFVSAPLTAGSCKYFNQAPCRAWQGGFFIQPVLFLPDRTKSFVEVSAKINLNI